MNVFNKASFRDLDVHLYQAFHGLTKSRFQLHPLLCVLAIFTLVGCKQAPSQRVLEEKVLGQQHTFELLSNSIEQHRAINGSYPLVLDEVKNLVVPQIQLPAHFDSLREAPINYEVSRDRSFFRLTYGIEDSADYNLHASLSYLSLNKKWELTNRLKRLSHVEAAHFGSQYKKMHSSDSLTLTVLSLLDSAKLNSTYPCRNFWREWVEEAIGSGEPLKHPLPKGLASDEIVVYVGEKGKPAYVFAFQKKLYPPMTKPLPIVEAVYQTQGSDGEWILVKRCDSSS